MKQDTVADWMTPDPVTVSPDTPATHAYDLMRQHHIRRLPVTDGDWLVGIVTLSDLWKVIQHLKADAELYHLPYQLSRIRVMDIMTHQVVTASPTMSVRQACQLMLKHNVGALSVMDEGQLVGILTESDIFRLVARTWSENECEQDQKQTTYKEVTC